MLFRSHTALIAAAAAGFGAALWAAACGGGAYGSSTPTSPSTSSATVGATITITANGLSDSAPRIALGQKIRFTNNDTKPHEILTTPHTIHTDCPGLNAIDVLAAGQSKDSDALNDRRGCGWHDHLNPDDNRWRGQVLVGLGASDPTPPDPGY